MVIREGEEEGRRKRDGRRDVLAQCEVFLPRVLPSFLPARKGEVVIANSKMRQGAADSDKVRATSVRFGAGARVRETRRL